MAASSYFQPETHLPPHPQQQTTYQMHPINPSYNTPLAPIEEPVSPIGYAPPQKASNPGGGRPFNRLRAQRLEKFKRWLRILRVLSKILSTLFSTVMFAIMVFVLFRYQHTKNLAHDAKAGVQAATTAWPQNAKIWPTLMLLTGSGVTLATSSITLMTYCCCWNRRRSWKVTVLNYAIHIGAWFVLTTLYRYEKGLHNVNNDLWGWSCGPTADSIQSDFPQLNFDGLCKVQVGLVISLGGL